MTAPTTAEGGGVAAYPRAGGAAWVRPVVRDLYRPVLDDDEPRRYFAAAGAW
jgi:hypothetical protein